MAADRWGVTIRGGLVDRRIWRSTIGRIIPGFQQQSDFALTLGDAFLQESASENPTNRDGQTFSLVASAAG